MSKGTATLDPTPRVVLGVLAWLAVAVGAGTSGVIHHAPYLVPLLLAASVIAGVALYRRDGALRRRVDAIDLRAIVLLHVVRAPIGAWLLVETARGVLPPLFGHRAGPGDIAIGVAAVVAAAALPARAGARRAAVAAWSVLGMIDLVLAFGTGQYLLFVVRDPRLSLIGDLPYALLPTFVVPFFLLTHLLVLARLRRA